VDQPRHPEHAPIFAKLKETGFDGVEVPLFEGDEAHYQAVGRELQQAGLKCSTITVCSPDASPVSADAAERTRALDRLKWCLDMTAAVGGDVLCGPYTAPLGVFTGREPSEDEKKRAADVLRAGAEHAQKLNARIAVEFLCRFETYMLNTARDAAAMVKRVRSSRARHALRTFHANIEEKDPPAPSPPSRKRRSTSTSAKTTAAHPAPGTCNGGDVSPRCERMNYLGWLTIEAFPRVLPELAAATRVWRDFFPSTG
jgi:D-psicose/D-tagatose/L-ribulose 3-epimerase